MKSKSFNVAELTAKRALLKTLKTEIAELVQIVKQEKVNMREAREVARAQKEAARLAKQAASIAKLEARLSKLKTAKARKNGPVTIYKGAEAQRLAA
jgi:uncharacterized protein YqfA (UPF0365 family)